MKVGNMGWRKPLDELTLKFLISRIVEDRDLHLKMAKEAKDNYGEEAGESFMIRAEECARIISQMRMQIEEPASPKPKQRVAKWPP